MLTHWKNGLFVFFLTGFIGFSGVNWVKANETVMQAQQLNQEQITQQLKTLTQWRVEEQQLSRTYQFDNFVQAIAFVNALVEPAETLGHHPDLTINYNRVTVSLTTHDAGGLTQTDFDLAQKIAQIYETQQNR